MFGMPNGFNRLENRFGCPMSISWRREGEILSRGVLMAKASSAYSTGITSIAIIVPVSFEPSVPVSILLPGSR